MKELVVFFLFPLVFSHCLFITQPSERIPSRSGWVQTKCLPANYLQFLIFIRPLFPHFCNWMHLNNNDYLARCSVNNWLVPASCPNFSTLQEAGSIPWGPTVILLILMPNLWYPFSTQAVPVLVQGYSVVLHLEPIWLQIRKRPPKIKSVPQWHHIFAGPEAGMTSEQDCTKRHFLKRLQERSHGG